MRLTLFLHLASSISYKYIWSKLVLLKMSSTEDRHLYKLAVYSWHNIGIVETNQDIILTVLQFVIRSCTIHCINWTAYGLQSEYTAHSEYHVFVVSVK